MDCVLLFHKISPYVPVSVRLRNWILKSVQMVVLPNGWLVKDPDPSEVLPCWVGLRTKEEVREHPAGGGS